MFLVSQAFITLINSVVILFTPGSCLIFPTNHIGLHFLIHLSPSICLGVSSTFAGQRLSKDDRIFEALGANDELSSTIGYGAYTITVVRESKK